ncbi:hypothetical protein [Kocuria arenosa]|uniref:hypothetical protein n=1 Tax=Kocuria arenosa TaxID=3071446 RepID=UPI0034D76FCB
MNTRGAGRSTVSGALGATVGTAVVNTRGAGRSTVSGALGAAVGAAIGTAILNARGTEGSAVGGTFRLVRILLCISHVDLPDFE